MAQKKGKVLCVDDEPNISRALQWLLQKEFEVLVANSGTEGLALLKMHDFDVVISDQRMPMMTGVEFLREVKRSSPRSVRILLTGYSDLQAILRSVNESEIYRFINKPWNISELPKVVDQAVHIAKTQVIDLVDPELTEDAPLLLAANDNILLIDDNIEMLAVIKEAVGHDVKVTYASNLADAVGVLNDQDVSVIVSETTVGSVDATRLIRLMKQKHPEIVSVMFTGQSDADTVTNLINQGQVYRFVPKPVRSGYLRLVINSALDKHHRLNGTPGLVERYKVDAMAVTAIDALLSDVNKVAVQVEKSTEKSSAGIGFLSRIGTGFKRLFSN